ncbi:FHA domain-containing protein [Actinopolymorpha alba]|uniref:FHA domain-containing protein n=1 Tax=Actinopolymorpha alba TaxID=533267 RepID=UPI00192B17DD|nr:FHA domain-containing protein [Actinopolymorpha alba]
MPRDIGTLARGLPPAEPDTLFVLGESGGISVSPQAKFDVVFGRNEPDVHVCVGTNDRYVSRQHGYITREYSRWVLTNLGRLPIRFPDRLVSSGEHAVLPPGFTPLFIVGPQREHLLEVGIAARPASPPAAVAHHAETVRRDPWELNEEERLVLVCLAQRYLRHEPHAQPETWARVENDLASLQPQKQWTRKKAAHKVANVRERLSRSGVSGLKEEEIPPPVGNALNHNLITELLGSSAISTADLRLLDQKTDADGTRRSEA